MLGDDPDPTVTKVRFGFGTNFGRARGGEALCKEGLRFKQEGKRRTRLVSEGSAEARGGRGHSEGMQVFKTWRQRSADAMQMMR